MFFNTYPDTQFVFCQPDIKSWKRPLGWDTETFPNVQFEELRTLVDALDQS